MKGREMNVSRLDLLYTTQINEGKGIKGHLQVSQICITLSTTLDTPLVKIVQSIR